MKGRKEANIILKSSYIYLYYMYKKCSRTYEIRSVFISCKSCIYIHRMAYVLYDFFLLFLIHVHHINMIFYFMIITLAILRFRSILHITPLCVHELNEVGCSWYYRVPTCIEQAHVFFYLLSFIWTIVPELLYIILLFYINYTYL